MNIYQKEFIVHFFTCQKNTLSWKENRNQVTKKILRLNLINTSKKCHFFLSGSLLATKAKINMSILND